MGSISKKVFVVAGVALVIILVIIGWKFTGKTQTAETIVNTKVEEKTESTVAAQKNNKDVVQAPNPELDNNLQEIDMSMQTAEGNISDLDKSLSQPTPDLSQFVN